MACRDVPLAVYLCTGKIAADHENTAAVLMFSILKVARRCFCEATLTKIHALLEAWTVHVSTSERNDNQMTRCHCWLFCFKILLKVGPE